MVYRGLSISSLTGATLIVNIPADIANEIDKTEVKKSMAPRFTVPIKDIMLEEFVPYRLLGSLRTRNLIAEEKNAYGWPV